MDKFEKEPGIDIQEWIGYFEQYANEIHQANAANVALEVITKNKDKLTAELFERLQRACEKGIAINPKGSKEQRMFQEFKEDINSLFPQE